MTKLTEWMKTHKHGGNSDSDCLLSNCGDCGVQ